MEEGTTSGGVGNKKLTSEIEEEVEENKTEMPKEAVLPVTTKEEGMPPPTKEEKEKKKKKKKTWKVSSDYIPVMLMVVYLFLGVVTYILSHKGFSPYKKDSGHKHTHPIIDGFYFFVVTLTSTGYGDIVPFRTFPWIFSAVMCLVGSGVMPMLDHIFIYLLSILEDNMVGNRVIRSIPGKFVLDVKKSHLQTRFKVTMAVFVPMACILIGACSLTISEKMAFVEGLYVAIVSVSTVGYGDKAFTTLWGRLIGALWLLFSVIVFTRVYDYVVDLFFRKKSWRVSKLCKEVTFEEMSKNGNIISEQDFMIHRLKELCDIREEEMQQLTDEYERMCKEMAKRNSNTAEAEV